MKRETPRMIQCVEGAERRGDWSCLGDLGWVPRWGHHQATTSHVTLLPHLLSLSLELPSEPLYLLQRRTALKKIKKITARTCQYVREQNENYWCLHKAFVSCPSLAVYLRSCRAECQVPLGSGRRKIEMLGHCLSPLILFAYMGNAEIQCRAFCFQLVCLMCLKSMDCAAGLM